MKLFVCYLLVVLPLVEASPVSISKVSLGGIPLTTTSQEFFSRRDATLRWELRHNEFGMSQMAFEVLIQTDHGVISSGKQYSNQTHYVLPLSKLERDSRYHVQVNWWDNKGILATGHKFNIHTVLGENWGNAKWIAADMSIHSPMFRHNLTLTGQVRSARAYVSGLGFYNFFLNGKPVLSKGKSTPAVGDTTLVPGWTRYEALTPYVAHDVTSMLPSSGELVVGVVLGKGWRDRSSFKPRDGTNPSDSHETVLRFSMSIEYESGTKVEVVSDGSWMSASSPITMSNVYNGETQDGRLEQEGWAAPGFTYGSGWKAASVVSGPGTTMFLEQIPSVQITAVTQPVHAYYEYNGNNDIAILDFGINNAGVCHLNIPAGTASGTTITLHHAEIPLHEPYGPQNGSLYFANLRSAKAMDTYITNGRGGETFWPRFTYHGFRYVRITGFPADLQTLQNSIRKLEFRTPLPVNGGDWKTSSFILNTIQGMIMNVQATNMMTVITDCDQRDERLGWMGDAGLSADSMALNYQTVALHANELHLMQSEEINGTEPDVVPYYRYGNRPADPAWGVAFPQVLWSMMFYYNDKLLAADFFQHVYDYLKFEESKVTSGGGISKMYGYYGDWVPPPPAKKVPVHYTSAFATIWAVNKIRDLAQFLGKTTIVQELNTLFTSYSKQFNDAFLQKGTYVDGGQTALALPITLGIVPAKDGDNINKQLLDDIAKHNNHLSTGIIGAKSLWPALSTFRQWEIGLAIMEQTDYPSWGWSRFNPFEPATGVWEIWNAWTDGPGMNSRNHHMFTSPSQWMMSDIVGLKPLTPGATITNLTAARVLAIASAGIAMKTPSIDWDWSRSGGTQCGKAPEGKSSHSPTLPTVPQLEINCGPNGGTIQSVDFASWGTPNGYCGMFSIDKACHSPNSLKVVENLCLNKASCAVPTQATLWGADPCFGTVKKLYVQVTCTAATSIMAEASFDHTVAANIILPLWGLNDAKITVTYDKQYTIWEHGHYAPGCPFIQQGTLDRDDVVFRATGAVASSKPYKFSVVGKKSSVVTQTVARGSTGLLKCEAGDTISRINFASYGNPSTGTQPQIGNCHVGSSGYTMETLCLGKDACLVKATDDVFGAKPCASRLHVVATCSH